MPGREMSDEPVRIDTVVRLEMAMLEAKLAVQKFRDLPVTFERPYDWARDGDGRT